MKSIRRGRGPSKDTSAQTSVSNRRELLIFAEGTKTEDIYLTRWHRDYRQYVIVNIAAHQYTTPFEIVSAAADRKKADLAEAKRGRGKAYDEYWCFFDVDDHPKLADALITARDNKLSVALSSPCLELWFVLHFADQTAYMDRAEAQRLSRQFLRCDKILTHSALDLLVASYPDAKLRAQALEKKHTGDGTAQPWNPHSTVWALVDTIAGNVDS